MPQDSTPKILLVTWIVPVSMILYYFNKASFSIGTLPKSILKALHSDNWPEYLKLVVESHARQHCSNDSARLVVPIEKGIFQNNSSKLHCLYQFKIALITPVLFTKYVSCFWKIGCELWTKHYRYVRGGEGFVKIVLNVY